MKKRIPTFLAGMLTMALVGSLGVGALAAAGQMTITVDPINIQVNGVIFQPKDAQGEEVPVFALNGTTYAPLRALAEAYGLEVGYDAQANMAVVEKPTPTPEPDPTTSPTAYSDWTAEEEAAYQEFKGLWGVTEVDEEFNYIKLNNLVSKEELKDYFIKTDRSLILVWSERYASELCALYTNSNFTFPDILYRLDSNTQLWQDTYYVHEQIISGIPTHFSSGLAHIGEQILLDRLS